MAQYGASRRGVIDGGVTVGNSWEGSVQGMREDNWKGRDCQQSKEDKAGNGSGGGSDGDGLEDCVCGVQSNQVFQREI